MLNKISLPSEWVNKNLIQKKKWENFKNSIIYLHKPTKEYERNSKFIEKDLLMMNYYLIF